MPLSRRADISTGWNKEACFACACQCARSCIAPPLSPPEPPCCPFYTQAAGLLKLKIAFSDEVPFSERERLTVRTRKCRARFQWTAGEGVLSDTHRG